MQQPDVLNYTSKQVIEKSKEVSDLSFKLLDEVVQILKPGVSESKVRLEAVEIFKKQGIEKSWHNPYIRFGTNTILTFKDKPAEDRILQDEDIAYIDIGPIINGVEGDAGCTLVLGENNLFHELKFQSESIFNLAVEYWKENKPTGIELYKYIYKLTDDSGFIFNLDPAGHLIGSFPHKGWKDGLHTYPYVPEAGYWILEIQIKHQEKPYGAFFEKILI